MKHSDKEQFHCILLFTKCFHQHYHILKSVHINKTKISILQIIYIDKQYSTPYRPRSEKGLFYINTFSRGKKKKQLELNSLNPKYSRQLILVLF